MEQEALRKCFIHCQCHELTMCFESVCWNQPKLVGSFNGFWALVSCSDQLNQHFCCFFSSSLALSLPPSWALWVAWIYFMIMLNQIWCCSYLLQHGKWRQMINCIKGDVYHHRVHLSQKDLPERNLGQSSQVHLEDFPKEWNAVYILLCLCL